jgi:acetyltransferase
VPGLVHRSDAGAVRLNLTGADAIRKAAADLLNQCSQADRAKARLLVTPMIEPGLELLCGAFRDPQFGPMVMVGLGGVQVEALEDVVLGLAPLAQDQAHDLIKGIRAQQLLDGHRGAPAVDRDRLATLLTMLARMMMALPELSEIEMNPVIVTASGLAVADARAVVDLELLS